MRGSRGMLGRASAWRNIVWLALAGNGWASAAAAEEATGGAAPAPVLFSEAAAQALDASVSDALQAFQVPGAALAVVSNGRIVHRAAFGVRDLASGEPVRLQTRFLVGSITKSITSMLLATLVDDGRLDWDDEVASLLPSFGLSEPADDSNVTLRQLLTHTSGVQQWDTPLFFQALHPLELIEFVRGIPLVAAPGQEYHYQNQLYAIAGYAAASAGGAGLSDQELAGGYRRLARERVFEPIGMPRATFEIDAVLRANHAVPHAYDPASVSMAPFPLEQERMVASVAPAGAAWLSIDDLARYALTQVQGGVSPDGVRVVSSASLLETQRLQVALGPGIGYGLGWNVDETGVTPLVWHAGGTAGFTALLLLWPEAELAIGVLTNRYGSDAFLTAVARRGAELAFGQPHASDEDLLAAEAALRDSMAQLMTISTPVTRKSVAGLLGRYESDVSVSQRDGELVLRTRFGEHRFRALPPSELLPAPDAFIGVDNVLSGATLLFEREAPGAPATDFVIGLPDPETGAFSQPFTVAREQRSAPRPRRDHRLEYGMMGARFAPARKGPVDCFDPRWPLNALPSSPGLGPARRSSPPE